MSITAKPFVQGKVHIITGPVSSDKNNRLIGFLDACVDSGYRNNDNLLLFRNPRDDKNPGMLGKHVVDEVTESVDDMYAAITPKTRTVIIAGASHYQDTRLIGLVDSLVRSNRDVILTGLNLDHEGNPHGMMPVLMGLADKVDIEKSICSDLNCRDDGATRSIKNNDGEYAAVCGHHAYHREAPPISSQVAGYLGLYLGCMFSGKTERWKGRLKKFRDQHLDPVVFKFLHDNRFGEEEGLLYGEGNVHTHSKKKERAILVRGGQDIVNYLTRHPRKKVVLVDEMQFMRGIYDAFKELIPKGYKIFGTGLPRTFERKAFGEVSEVMCLANNIEMNYATCVECGDPATESQRMKKIDGVWVPCQYGDDVFLPGGAGEGYQARCLKDWILPGEPPLEFKLDKFEW